MALGGRAAEEIIFGKISTGALSDLERITKMAYSIVTMYGMNDKIGNISYYDSKGANEYSTTKPYSEATAQTIDNEVRKIIQGAYDRTKQLLTSKLSKLEIVAQELLQKEILFQTDLERLVGPRPFAALTTYQAHTAGTDRSKTLSEVEQETHPIPIAHENGKSNGQENQEEPEKEKESEGATPGSTYSFDV
jgi:cell division protease FtsH